MKAPTPDILGFQAIRLRRDCDSNRIVAITKTVFQLGIHPGVRKDARGEVVPKSNKPDYRVGKASRVITLLNCVGKVVEMVAANAIPEQSERRRLLHDRQFGCRKRRSAIDAVGSSLIDGSGLSDRVRVPVGTEHL